MLVRLNEPMPVAAKLFWTPGIFGSGRRFKISSEAMSIRFAGMVLLGNGLRNLGSALDSGSKTVMPVPVKLTLPFASGRRLAPATLNVPPAAFRCVVRSRSVKKNSLFLPFQIFGPPSPKCGRITGPLKAYPNCARMFLGFVGWLTGWKKVRDLNLLFVS